MRWTTLLFSALVLGCGGPQVTRGGTGEVTEPPNPSVTKTGEAGEVLYDKYCALCHAEEGKGYAADNANALSNIDFLASVSDQFLRLAIFRGRPGTAMAAYHKQYGGPLSSDEVELIIGYVRSFQQGAGVKVDHVQVRGDAAAGKPIYDKQCADCHGAQGEGKTSPSVSNPLFLASASDGFIRFAIERGRRGTPMPSFAELLKPREIDNVTRYIRSMSRNIDTTPPTGEVPPTFDNIVVNPKGPQPDFDLQDGRFVSAADVNKAYKAGARMVLLDARPTSDWLKMHIPGALPVPYYEPEKMIELLPRDGTWILAYCGCPHAASGRVVDALRAAGGFDNTAVIDEGIFVWMARGYPVTFGAQP